jgi:hypothetical protein
MTLVNSKDPLRLEPRRPRLSIGKMPLSLQAYKAKIKGPRTSLILSNLDHRTSNGPRKPAPFVEMSGEVSPYPQSWTSPSERNQALNRWVAIIAREVSRRFPPGLWIYQRRN